MALLPRVLMVPTIYFIVLFVLLLDLCLTLFFFSVAAPIITIAGNTMQAAATPYIMSVALTSDQVSRGKEDKRDGKKYEISNHRACL
jgi:hypothetical protein